MIQLVLASLLLFYLPGAVVFRLPGRSREYRAALPFDERVFWAVLTSVVWSVFVVLALGALGQYSFGRLLATNAAVSGLLILAFRGRLRTKAPLVLSGSALVPLALIAAGLWLYFPASEYVIGGKDPGTYINTGIQIAQRGRVVVRDDTIAEVPRPLADLFFPSHEREEYYGIRFMGFFIQDPAQGTVISQFPHLYPASVAIGYGLDGLTGARDTIGAWAILGILAVYFAGARIVGRTAAGLAAALLSINVATIWFARYPNSELPMQALLFAAILAAERARTGGGRYFAIAAGLLFGGTLFLRYEILLAFVGIAAVGVLAPVAREKFGLSFVVAFAISTALGLWYLLDPMRAYSYYPLGFLSNRGGWPLAIAAGAGALLAQRLLRIGRLQALVRRWLPVGLAAALAVLAIYAYFFREAGGRTAVGDAIAFRTFAWYLTPGVLAAAVAGAVWFIGRRFWHAPLFFLTFAIFSVFFFYKTRIVPEHFWTSRRFLGMALPGSLMLATGVVVEAVGAATRWRGLATVPASIARTVGVVVAIALTAPAARAFWTASTPVRHHVEYASLIPHLETLAQSIGDRDLVVVESRDAGSDLHVIAVPLAYIYARHVLVLNSRAPDRRTFETFVAWADQKYDRVLFLGGGGTDLLAKGVSARPLGGDKFQVPEYDTTVNAYPTGIHQKEFEYGLYQLVAGTTARTGAVDLQIGRLDDLNVVRFHAREVHGTTGVPYRWSQGQSLVVIDALPPGATTCTIWMGSGGRPAAAPPPVVEVSIAGRVLGTATPANDTAAFSFALPADLVASLAATGDPVRIQLRVPTWKPSEFLGGADNRELGVVVSRVEVR